MDHEKDSTAIAAPLDRAAMAGRRRLVGDALLAAFLGDDLEDVNNLSDEEFLALVKDVRAVSRLAEGTRLAFEEPSEDISHLTNEDFIKHLLG